MIDVHLISTASVAAIAAVIVISTVRARRYRIARTSCTATITAIFIIFTAGARDDPHDEDDGQQYEYPLHYFASNLIKVR
jgi:hypothetical protein